MTYGARLVVCAAVSAAGHLLFARGLAGLPPAAKAQRPREVRVRIVEPPPPPPAPEPVAPEPPKVHEAPPSRPRPPVRVARAEPPAQQAPPTERPAPVETPATPVFGISMESTSQAGGGPSVPVGNTLEVGPATPGKSASRETPSPVPAYEVTKMPLPEGRCEGHYTDAARRAGLEGTVVLDLVVGADGAARDVVVAQGLGLGLSEAAVAALRGCHFTPGERDGVAVPVRLRGFKIRFFLAGSD